MAIEVAGEADAAEDEGVAAVDEDGVVVVDEAGASRGMQEAMRNSIASKDRCTQMWFIQLEAEKALYDIADVRLKSQETLDRGFRSLRTHEVDVR